MNASGSTAKPACARDSARTMPRPTAPSRWETEGSPVFTVGAYGGQQLGKPRDTMKSRGQVLPAVTRYGNEPT
jgi:hypothetical protein